MITIFVEGGVVQDVMGISDYKIIDLDNIEGDYECPNCGRVQLNDDLSCPTCGIVWNNTLDWQKVHEFIWSAA